ncbi:hypothetical protein PMAYCL1PPCAC_32988, partial [Pristionchus mayeri]
TMARGAVSNNLWTVGFACFVVICIYSLSKFEIRQCWEMLDPHQHAGDTRPTPTTIAPRPTRTKTGPRNTSIKTTTLSPPVSIVLVTPEVQCTERHFVVMLGGAKQQNIATALYKSILFHVRGSLVFHFLADDHHKKIISTLFKTWKLPSVRYHIYDMEPYKRELSWVPNTHYAMVTALVRLVVPEILPDNVKEALIVDTDMCLLDDISPIFDAFQGTNESVLFAMTENISPYYTNGMDPWPVRGRGLNSGLVLLNVERMRLANWSRMWRREMEERLQVFKYGHDQDVFNALTVTYPDIVVRLPCEYNLQLGVMSEPWTCLTSDMNVKIIHFNSPLKLDIKTKYVAHFARLHAEYLAMDGYSFRRRHRCELDNSTATYFADLPETDAAHNISYRTHMYFNGFNTVNATDDITLVTQLPAENFKLVKQILEIWKGPISAAIYCSDAKLPYILEDIESVGIDQRTNFALHVVFKTGNHFPVDDLRKVAIDGASTKFAYIMDYDASREVKSISADEIKNNTIKIGKEGGSSFLLFISGFSSVW